MRSIKTGQAGKRGHTSNKGQRQTIYRDAKTGRFTQQSGNVTQKTGNNDKTTIDFHYLTAEEVEKRRNKAYNYLL
jgi:hypothetical protein